MWERHKCTAMAKLIEPQLFKNKFNLYEQPLRYISSDKKENMELYNSCKKKKVGKEYKFLLLDIQNICSKVHKKLIHQLTPRRDIMWLRKRSEKISKDSCTSLYLLHFEPSESIFSINKIVYSYHFLEAYYNSMSTDKHIQWYGWVIYLHSTTLNNSVM